MQTSGPWYRQFDMWATRANHYLDALARLPKDAPHHKELEAYEDFSQAQLIFESNLIEGAELSEGDTRKVTEDYFPKLPSSYEAFRRAQRSIVDYITNSPSPAELLEDIFLHSWLKHGEITPSVLLANKSRPMVEVARHAMALHEAASFTDHFKLHWLIYQIAKKLPSIRSDPRFLKTVEARRVDLDIPPQLITEGIIRTLHERMATGLLPRDAGVQARHYQIDSRIVGWDIMFPAPELVPEAMGQYVAKAQQVLTDALDRGLDRFLAAAQISYDFVRIHPFPDFNGRVSRLLLVMVLNACGVPFPVTLRGESKSKKRYFRALKFGNAGNLKPYAALIAMRVVRAFEVVEDNLALAGLPSILSFARPPEGAKPLVSDG